MSFDIFFMPCRFGSEPIEQLDPNTGTGRSVLPNDPLDSDELAAVRALLESARVSGPADSDFYDLRCADGGAAQVHADHLDTGCMVCLRGMTPDLASLLLHLLRAGNWVMIPVMENTAAITTSRERLKGIPKTFPEIVVCESPEQLRGMLEGGLTAWRQYRDRIIGNADPPTA